MSATATLRPTDITSRALENRALENRALENRWLESKLYEADDKYFEVAGKYFEVTGRFYKVSATFFEVADRLWLADIEDAAALLELEDSMPRVAENRFYRAI
jgi:hypothetical protein